MTSLDGPDKVSVRQEVAKLPVPLLLGRTDGASFREKEKDVEKGVSCPSGGPCRSPWVPSTCW